MKPVGPALLPPLSLWQGISVGVRRLPSSLGVRRLQSSPGRNAATPVVVTVLNNGVLAYQLDAEDVKYGRHTGACTFSPVDHAAIARACGCRGINVRHPREYLPALREAIASGETTLIDVDTDPEAYPPITLFDGKLDAVRAQRRQAGMRKAA